MKHYLLAAALMTAIATPAMAGDYDSYTGRVGGQSATDMSGLYEALMYGVDGSELPRVPEGGPYGAPAVTRDIVAAEAPSAKPDESAREAKQQRYEELLHARFDEYVREYDVAIKHAREAALREQHDNFLLFLDEAREAKRHADEMNNLWLESQKP